jgi:predicted component of type VI protein secretion system
MTTTEKIRQDIAPGCRAMAERSIEAERNFIGILRDIADLSEADARTVFDAYRRLGLVKRQLAIGRYDVTHGAFLDRETILRALTNLKST